MEEKRYCKNCGWFRLWAGANGNCSNPRNAEIKYVGGGGEYGSSEQCLVAPRVNVACSCAFFERFERSKPYQLGKVIDLPRPPEMKPWESTPWSIVD